MHHLLGHTGTDRITGFAGVITGHLEYLSGCDQLLLAPKVDSEGKAREGQWFDQQRVEISHEHARIVLDNRWTPGADQPAPVGRRSDAAPPH